jgi:glycosyltransferase involved in cell wall biosynthesis
MTRVAINCRFLIPNKLEGFGWYTWEITKRLTEQHPEVEFILFFDRTIDSRFQFGQHVKTVVLSPPARHPILFIYWFEFAVRKALKKYKADLFFSPDGYLSLTSQVPQIGTIHDINFEHFPKDIPIVPRNYLRIFFKRFAKKATHLITVSHYSKTDISTTYNIPEDRITAIWNGVSDAYHPLTAQEQETVQKKYSQDSEYILFVGSLHPRKNVFRLIEAYKQLKKDHPNRSEKLVIVGENLFRSHAYQSNIDPSIEHEILFTGHLTLEALSKVMGAAKIFAFVPYFEGFGIPLVEAMRCGTPILCGNKTSLPEVVGEAALLVDPFDVNQIASEMHRLLENETLRDELRTKALERSKLFSWDVAAEQVWHVINSTLKHNKEKS